MQILYIFCKLIFTNILFEETIGRVCFLTPCAAGSSRKIQFSISWKKSRFRKGE